ncbi:MAG TPA: hypothetical protein PLQ71_20905 [Nitrospira sp.]|nr:hypothetical protein [Nitrospira sp.]
MNLGTLISNFRIDERDTSTPPMLGRDHLVRLFNEATEEAAIRKSLLRENLEFVLSAGDSEVSLPPRIIEVRTARIVEGGATYWLSPSSRHEQDRLFRNWRDTVERPSAFIHDDISITLNRIVLASSVLKLECCRTPVNPMEIDEDEPEIAAVHHRYLDGWVRYRAYRVPDVDFMDKDRSDRGLADFEDYFGRRPTADHRRDNNADRPHRVKAW